MSFKKSQLPTFAFYKTNCHHSINSWLIYQSGIGEIRLLNFNKDGTINQIFILDVSPQPISSIRLAYDSQENIIYAAIAYHSKFIVLRKNYVIAQYSLTLNCNIVDFQNGFVGVQGVSDGRQVYFVFITAKGKIITQPVGNIENRSVVDLTIDKQRVTAICVSDGWGFIGSQNGEVFKVDLNSRKIHGKYFTKSQLPIISMKLNKNILYAATCDGQINVLTSNLQILSTVVAHAGMIVFLHIGQNYIYSVGDDCILRIWSFENKLLIEKECKEYNQRPNLLFTVEGQTYINFYESMKYEPI